MDEVRAIRGSLRFVLIVEELGQSRNPVHLPLGQATNNEAEYLCFLSDLETLHEEQKGRKIEPKSSALKIYGDSQLLISQENADWKAIKPKDEITSR